jgi:hypothetical protein
MLRLHNFMKRSDVFQSTCSKHQWEFPPGSSWIVFTDTVPHAALSGRYALEQTYFIPHSSLLLPELAPFTLFEELVRSHQGGLKARVDLRT